MNVLVTGKNGQLGSEIKELSVDSKLNFIFLDAKEGDVTNLDILSEAVKKHKINALINCAAYTAVDNAEDDIENAFLVNEIGVKNIDVIALKTGLKYIHISTDYVFDGTAKVPYTEGNPINPIGVYGRSKRKGEEIVIESKADAILIRTSWLYSTFGNNFVKTMLRLGKDRDELNVVSDQFGTPTYAKDLAAACIHILESEGTISEQGRIYHFSNQGVTDWSSFASEIFDLKRIPCKVNPIATEDYPTKAERPKYSALDASKITTNFEVKNRNWKEGLKDCLSNL